MLFVFNTSSLYTKRKRTYVGGGILMTSSEIVEDDATVEAERQRKADVMAASAKARATNAQA
ncbi:hypothetical protein L914_06646 [Phytophthora nicotianae]|uniref:Uncharacterized protein n=1 Tax=Phytophthora nicotianae TaxID=4792 RepID=W2NK13_PHYNI|nr:hypothetical protein L914_06646 [Phytophthora nicotianae]